MAMDPRNPYAAPSVPVADLSQQGDDGQFVEGGRTVPSGNGWEWIVEGFNLFKMNPGIWILNLIILFGILIVLAIIPVVGNLAINLLYPVFGAGLMLGCHALDHNEALEVAHLFAGFKEKTGSLVLVGLLYLVGVVVIVLVVGLFFGFSLFASMLTAGHGNFNPMMLLLAVLIAMALSIPLVMAIWFAPALVVFHDLQPIDAMKQSFMGCMKNIVPFLVYGIIGFVIGIIALIPAGLGWLVWGPTVVASIYASYRDIFIEVA